MNRYNGLMYTISTAWNIPRGATEDEITWMSRLLYSVLGRMAYASAHDIPENDGPVSVTHVKHRVERVCQSYLAMYPELAPLFADVDGIEDELYQVLLQGGQLYHAPNQIVPAMPASAQYDNLVFTRGTSASSRESVSGIGTYHKVGNALLDADSLQRMFQLERMPLRSLWEHTVAKAIWTTFSGNQQFEFLRTKPPFTYGYWVNQPDQTGHASLCRTTAYGTRIYYLYKKQNGAMLVHQLPVWATDESRYRSLSNGCLSCAGVLPPSTFQRDGKVIKLKFNYLPPPAELNLMKLYSWPESYTDFPHDFKRVFSADVFFALKSVLETAGYQFTEEG